MRIAEVDQVARAYPGVPRGAVELLLYALHRAAPAILAGDTDAAAAGLRHDLAHYGGPMADLERLRVPAIFTAIDGGRRAAADTLALLGMIADQRARVRFVIVGDTLAGRMWARERGYGLAEIICVSGPQHAERLRALDPAGVAIVRLGDAAPALEEALTGLLERGAISHSGRWRPGEADAHPAIDLRGPTAVADLRDPAGR